MHQSEHRLELTRGFDSVKIISKIFLFFFYKKSYTWNRILLTVFSWQYRFSEQLESFLCSFEFHKMFDDKILLKWNFIYINLTFSLSYIFIRFINNIFRLFFVVISAFDRYSWVNIANRISNRLFFFTIRCRILSFWIIDRLNYFII